MRESNDLLRMASRYEADLRFRLVHVVESIDDRCPDLSESSGFVGHWAVVGSLSNESLARALRQPLLDSWVQRAEHMLALDLFTRYPDGHPARHLKDFGRLALSCAEEGCEGRLPLLGRCATPLAFGTAHLLATQGPPEGFLDWKVKDGVLVLDLAGQPHLGEVDLRSPEQSSLRLPGWEVRALPRVGEVVIDLGLPEYDPGSWPGLSQEQSEERLLAVLRELEEIPPTALRACASAFLRSITLPGSEDGRWVAGLVRWNPGEGRAPDWLRLVHLSLRDGVRRVLGLQETSAKRGEWLPPDFVELAAWRLGDRLLGGGDESSNDLARRWTEAAARLAGSESGRAILLDLGEPLPTGGEGARPGEGPPARLHLSALDRFAALNHPRTDPFFLDKTRRGATHRICDWSALDRLVEADSRVLAEIAGRLASQESWSEEEAFTLAICFYLLGRYPEVLKALGACLAFDQDVEEFWHLLACTWRHLGSQETFDRIVFDQVRDRGLVTRPTEAVR